MGTWDSGPFDNDIAADWCCDLDDANPRDRPTLIRATLIRAADEDDYLDSSDACEAIAAAAIVAAQLPGGEPIDSAYAPDFLRDGDSLDLPDDLAALAVDAIDRIMADNSEWLDLWQDADGTAANAAFDAIRSLRAVLARPRDGEQVTDTPLPLFQAAENAVAGTSVPWRRSGDLLAQILRRHSVDPAAVTDTERAWHAFREFLQTEVNGLTPDQDADGFIIQWGRHSWYGDRPYVSFTRQLAVPSDRGDFPEHPDYWFPEQPEYWQVDLTLVFNDAPGLAVLDDSRELDTRFCFEPAGPRRDAAITEAAQREQLQAAFQATPAYSALAFDQVC